MTALDAHLRQRQAREIAAAIRAQSASGAGVGRASLGERFVGLPAYQRAQSAGAFRAGGTLSIDLRNELAGRLLSTRELAAALRLRTYTDLLPFSIDGAPFVAANPLPATVPGLVETIPTDEAQVELTDELADVIIAGGAPDGTPLPEATFNAGQAPNLTTLPRFGLAWPVSKGVLDQPGRVQSLLEGRLDLGFTFGLEQTIINGNAEGNGPGVLNVSGIEEVGFQVGAGNGAEYRHDVLARAVSKVTGNGWYLRPLQVVIAPDALERVVTERAAGSGDYLGDTALPTVDAWLPSLALPAGTAVVGDWFDAVALFVKDGLDVAISGEHLDFFQRALLEFKLESRLYAWPRRPDALCVVTGL